VDADDDNDAVGLMLALLLIRGNEVKDAEVAVAKIED
jgi:hypothetical protein